jgi:hypothetical protein
LSLSNQDLTNEDIKVVRNFLNNNKDITKLQLHANKIGDEGARILSELKTLKFFDLDGNQISEKGVMFFKQNKTISSLRLNGHQFTNKVTQFFQSECNKLTGDTSVNNPEFNKIFQGKETTSAPLNNIKMMVLGGFFAALGVTAVALAFTALSTAMTGLLVVGCIAGIGGLGLFSIGLYKQLNKEDKGSSDSLLSAASNLIPSKKLF